MPPPSIEQTFIQSLWRRIPLKFRVLLAIVAMLFIAAMLIGAFSAIHDHGYNKGQAEGKVEIQAAHDETQQAIGAAKAAQDDVNKLQTRLAQSEGETAQAKSDAAEAKKEVNIKAQAYYAARNRPVRVRPKGVGVSDAELIRDAKGMGLEIR